MPTPNSNNYLAFKNYLRVNKEKFTSGIQTCILGDIQDILVSISAGIDTSQVTQVIIFDDNERVGLSTVLTERQLFYVPALPNDSIIIGVGTDGDLGIKSSRGYRLDFVGDGEGVRYENQTYGLNSKIGLGTDISLRIVGLGGALLLPEDPPSYNIAPSTNNVLEGGVVSFTVTTTNIGIGTVLFYSIVGSASSTDFVDNSLTGSFSIQSISDEVGISTFTKTIAIDDDYDEFTEGFRVNILTGSTSGALVATSSTVFITNLEEPSYSIGVSTTSLNEGESITFTTTAENVASSTELFYTISGDVSANDFVQNTLSGSFTVIDFGNGIPVGSVTKNIALDLVEEGDDTFVFQVRTGSTSGTIVATSSTITIKDVIPTFTIIPTVNSINEGQSTTFNVTTTGVADQTQIFFTTIGNASASDFSDNSLSGSFTILNFGGLNGVGALTRNTVFDFNSQQNKNFQIQLRLNSISGPIVGTSTVITVNNISPSFAITSSSNIINEGQSVTFTISTNVPNGFVVFHTTLGGVSASDFSDNSLSGSVTINNGTATIVKTTVRDRKTEGDEQFAIQLRLNSVTGNIITASSFVIIKDTSRNIGENANGITFGPVQVNRDNGNPLFVTDWYKICNIDDLPEGSKIALFIDTSGSMTQATIQASYDLFVSKLAEKNISIITVTNSNEDWITPFLTELN